MIDLINAIIVLLNFIFITKSTPYFLKSLNFRFSDINLKFLIFLSKNITGNGLKVKTPK